MIQKLGITCLVCTPAVSTELLKFCKSEGINPTTIGLKVILFLGELISPARMNIISEQWGVRGFNCMYASQEASIIAACSPENKLETIPVNVLTELLDPDTSKPIDDITPGTEGELVITHLYRGCKPLIRYRTGDMIRIQAVSAEKWTIQPIGRIQDRISIGGRNLCAFDVEQAIFEKLQECFEFLLKIFVVDDVEQLEVVLEKCPETNNVELIEYLEDILRKEFGVKIRITVGDVGAEVGTAAMVSWKAARVQDFRIPETDEKLAARKIARNR